MGDRSVSRNGGRIFRCFPLYPLLLVLGLAILGPVALAAQSTAPRADATGSIGGRVLDTETLLPLEGARVLLEFPAAGGASAPERDVDPRPARVALTDASGQYRFSALPPARYRIVVERIGYLTRALQVELQPGQDAGVSIGLEVQPIRLPEVEVVGGTLEPYPRSRSPEADLIGARAHVARLRQRAYLPADARELTHGEVIEAVTLGEPDLFRALQRVPGVATRDDYTATIWTRGATWDQTRVYLDGLELYNPTHAGWLFSAVNPDAIGSVVFQPGYRSSRWGEGTAAILDLRTRSGNREGALRGSSEISPASARLALDGNLGDGQLRWMVAGRRTYVDLLTRLMGEVTGERDLYIPYDFSDVIFRVDGETDDGWGFEVSSILERDHLRGDIPGIVRGNRGQWGNRAGQITLSAPIPSFGMGPLRARMTAGQTLFGTSVQADSLLIDDHRAIHLPPLQNDVQHQVLGLRVSPAAGDTLRWSAGYQLIRDGIRYLGPASLLGVLTAAETEEIDLRVYQDLLVYSALWGERRWRPGERLEVELGARVEIGDSVYNGGRARVSPRAAVRSFVGPGTVLSGAWSRTYQYTQDVSPAAGPLGPQLHLSAIWLLATDQRVRPAARADVATLGLERWIGNEWLGSVNGYLRRTTGLLIPNPDTGAVRPGREPDAVAENSASGLEFSVRRLTGRWTGSVGYTVGTSRMTSTVERGAGETVRYDFAAPAHVPHALDVTGMVRMGGGFRAGGAFTYGSGVGFTRLVLPDTARPRAERSPPRLQLPYAVRTPNYASLDLMLEYSRAVGEWQVSAYAQLRNALGHENAVTYLGSRDCGSGPRLASFGPAGVDCEGVEPGVQIMDRFQAGLPRLPLLGVRLAF